jgi:hypothetical protein
MRGFASCAIEPFARNDLTALNIGGQAMQKYRTRGLVVIVATAGTVYHFAVLAALAMVVI